jgi:hypothetical protein
MVLSVLKKGSICSSQEIKKKGKFRGRDKSKREVYDDKRSLRG